jgi:hypothetical protein
MSSAPSKYLHGRRDIDYDPQAYPTVDYDKVMSSNEGVAEWTRAIVSTRPHLLSDKVEFNMSV